MPRRSHRAFGVLVLLGVLAAAGCGGSEPTGDIDQIRVELSPFEVIVTNMAGRALFDVLVEIEPVGPASHFTTRVARMENAEKRTLSHMLFSDRDAVQFSPRTVKAKGVIVTAKDIDGKEFRVEVPWKS